MMHTDERTRPRARGRRAGIAALLLAALAAACAVSVPPSGGPEDRTAPKVTHTVPRADSAGVDPASPIRIGFSEPMTRTRLERQVVTSPPIRIARVGWEDGALVIYPEGGLARDTTYVVRLKPGFRDQHGVVSESAHEFAFATGAALDSARIEGTVWLRREPAKKAVVRCFRLPGADTLDLEVARADRETAAGPDGRFALRYLPSAGGRFRVMAFADQNGNGVFDRATEAVAVLPDTFVLAAAVQVVADVKIKLVDPNEPGVVRGRVFNETGIDTARVLAALYAPVDSTRAAYTSPCDSSGAYEFRQVKAGEYVLRAFVDLKADSVAGRWPCPGGPPEGCEEPVARLARPVVVKPAGELEAPGLVIRRREEP
jgi:uncharacterized protein (DUF2141 family)